MVIMEVSMIQPRTSLIVPHEQSHFRNFLRETGSRLVEGSVGERERTKDLIDGMEQCSMYTALILLALAKSNEIVDESST